MASLASGDGASAGAKSHTNLFVGAVVGLAMFLVLSVLAVVLLRPDRDNTAVVATLLGVVVPIITAFLAAAVQQLHAAVNSRLSQLVELTAKSSRAEGELAAQEMAARLVEVAAAKAAETLERAAATALATIDTAARTAADTLSQHRQRRRR